MLQMAVEEIAKACASSALILMVQELGTLPIQLFGTDEQKQRFLPRCASGEWSPAFALSEPEAGSDPAVAAHARRARRRRVGHQRPEELDHERRHRRLLPRLRQDRPREQPQLVLHRRGRPRGLRPRQARAQARHQGLADRQPVVHRRARAGREPARHRGQGPVGRARHARAHAPGRRRAGRRDRPGRDRLRRRLRARADRLRQADQPDAGHPVQARRHGDAHGRRARAALQGVLQGRPRRAGSRQVLVDGQALRLRQRDVRDARGDPGPRRLRLRQRVSGRADDARCEDHADLRGHERDPAGRHRPLDAGNGAGGHARAHATPGHARRRGARWPSAWAPSACSAASASRRRSGSCRAACSSCWRSSSSARS